MDQVSIGLMDVLLWLDTAPASYYLKSASTYSVGRKGILENMLDGNSIRLAYHEKDKTVSLGKRI
jgi:hypothetical protein